MRQSQLFSKTRKEAPSGEVSRNAELLIKAGFIYKEMAGAYAYLPLGLRVIEKLKNIIRQEMNALSGQELIMTSLQRKELWEKTNRWSDKEVDIWFKSQLKNGTDIGFGWSHEEAITEMMKNYVSSFRDLPILVYQFQNKFRNETRAKSGIMRGREFVMKDLYSYSRNEADHEVIYKKMTDAYLRIFDRVGLGDKTFFTYASGGAFTKWSHEFQTICDAGEDIIYVDRKKKLAVNKEVYTDEVLQDLGMEKSEFEEVKSAEVGNIFSFGGEKSKQLDLTFTDEDGEEKPVILGSYGIGVTRLMGVLAEVCCDDRGLVWPKEVAPFRVHLVCLGANEEADALYQKLEKEGIEVLYDDRSDASAGEKFADADLLGIPYRVVVSPKTIEKGAYEIKKRDEKDSRFVQEEELFDAIS